MDTCIANTFAKCYTLQNFELTEVLKIAKFEKNFDSLKQKENKIVNAN